MATAELLVDDDPRHGVVADLEACVPVRIGRRGLRPDVRPGLPGLAPRRARPWTRGPAWPAGTAGSSAACSRSWAVGWRSTDDVEAKLLLDRHSQHHAWRAAQWWDRLPLLADVDRDALVAAPSAAMAAGMDELARRPDLVERLAGAYRVALPRLVGRYRAHQQLNGPAGDASAIRTLDLLVPDVTNDWRDGEVLLQRHLVDADAVERAAATVVRLERALDGVEQASDVQAAPAGTSSRTTSPSTRPRPGRPGIPAIAATSKRAHEERDAVTDGAHPPQAQPHRRVRLPRLRLAGPRSRAPQAGRVLRKRGQARRRRGDPPPGGRPLLRRPPGERAGHQERLVARGARAGWSSRSSSGPGRDHYDAVTWDEALDLVADELQALDDPDQAVFYTSGRASNEAAFVYQLFARAFGTNNLPDCSNMCHESSGTALGAVIGVGKGSVTLDDLEHADLIVICGQNPGHATTRACSPISRWPSATAPPSSPSTPSPKRACCASRIPSRYGVRSAGGPPWPTSTCRCGWPATRPSSSGIGKMLVEAGAAALDTGFIASVHGRFRVVPRPTPRPPCGRTSRPASGLPRDRIEALAHLLQQSPAIIVCWAMGLTQHRNSVASIQEIANVLLLRRRHRPAGRGGLPGAGSQQRAGRPDHGHLGADAGSASSTPCGTSSASTRPAGTGGIRSMPWLPCGTGGPGSCSPWAATWSGLSPIRPWPRRPSGVCDAR